MDISINRQASPQLEKSFADTKRRSVHNVSTHPTGNYTLSTASVRRSPSLSGISPLTPCPNMLRNLGEFSFPTPTPGSAPGPEQIIDLMEREQDAIVLKLMKEIEHLKSENKALRQNAAQGNTLNFGVRRSSSLSSHHRNSSSVSSVSSQSSVSTVPHNGSTSSIVAPSSKRSSSIFVSYSLPVFHDYLVPKPQKPEIKEVSPTSRTNSTSRSRKGSICNNDPMYEENKMLKLEVKRLRHELEKERK